MRREAQQALPNRIDRLASDPRPPSSLCVHICQSFYSLSGGNTVFGEGERAGRSPDLTNRD